MPGQPELAMAAIASGGVCVLEELVRLLGIPDDVISAIATQEQCELERREREYRDRGPPIDLEGRTGILVEDGLATSSSI